MIEHPHPNPREIAGFGACLDMGSSDFFRQNQHYIPQGMPAIVSVLVSQSPKDELFPTH
jgi:hypothetical protein